MSKEKGKGLLNLLLVLGVMLVLVCGSVAAAPTTSNNSPTGLFGAAMGVLFSFLNTDSVSADVVLDTTDIVGYAQENIKITEVWANPTGSDADYEFFEISNLGDQDVTITCGKEESDWGWTNLHSRADGASPIGNDFHLFGEYGCDDFVLGAGESVVLGRDITALSAKFPDANCRMIEYREDISLNNEGGFHVGHAPGLEDPIGDEVTIYIGRNPELAVAIDSVAFDLEGVDDSDNSLHFLKSDEGVEGTPTPCVAKGGSSSGAADDKEEALAILESLSASDKRSQKELDRAIKRVTQSLGNRIDGGDSKIVWTDENHLECRHGHKAFDKERQAVGHLRRIRDSSLEDDVDQVIELLVNADRTLAETAIDEAPDGRDKDRAQKVFDQVESYNAARIKIHLYRKVWKYLC